MNKTLLSSAVVAGVVLGMAGAPPSAFAGGRSHSSTSIGVSTYGGYGTSVGYRHWDNDRRWDNDRHWYGGRGRYYGHYHHHDGTGEALLGAMIGLLAFGAIASATDHNDSSSYSYAGPPPSYGGPSYGGSGYGAPGYGPSGDGCHVVNRIGPDRNGRTVKFAATMCYDGSGTPYILPDSQRIIERY